LPRSHVAWTVIGGRVIVREGKWVGGSSLDVWRDEAFALAALRSRTLGN
jgi:hypothetical protein